MNNIRRIIAAVAAVSCLAAVSFTSCSDKNTKDKSSSSSSSKSDSTQSVLDMMKDFEFVTNESGVPVAAPFQSGDTSGQKISTSGADVNAPDPTAANGHTASSDTDTAYETVTDANGETVTEMVAVTDENGASMTDADGQAQTTAVAKTQPAANNNGSSSGNNSDNNNNNNNGGGNAASSDDYVSATQKVYIYWMDISKNIDYYFNDEFIKVTFKIKDNIPDGDYPVTFTYDFSNKEAQTATKPDNIYQGVIKVNNGTAVASDHSSETGFICYSDDVACKQGDTIEFYACIKNNPGLVAMLNWVNYDSNAMELLSIEPAGEFAEIASGTSTGTPVDVTT